MYYELRRTPQALSRKRVDDRSSSELSEKGARIAPQKDSDAGQSKREGGENGNRGQKEVDVSRNGGSEKVKRERADIVPPANRPERDGASDEFQAANGRTGKVEIAAESGGLSPFRNTRAAER